jgi:Co/Zn/Cd efflux system component
MERTPSGISTPQVRADIQSISGVMEVHDLHLWDLRPGKTILTAHVVSQTGREREVLMLITDWCREKRIYHSTVQVEEREWTNNEEYISCEHDIH